MCFFIKRILFALFLLAFDSTVRAQNKIYPTDTLSQKSFQELSDLFYKSKPDTLKAIQYAKVYYKKALIEKDTAESITGKYYLADIKNDENIFFVYCDSLIEVTKKKPTKNYPAIIYYEKGRFLKNKNKSSRSLENLLTVHKQKIKNDSLQQISNIIIAGIKSKIGKKTEAISLYKKTYSYAKKNDLLKYRNFHVTLLNLAISYQKLNQLDSALYYNKKAIKLYKRINDSLSLGYTFYINGDILYKKKEYYKSITAYLESIPFLISDENYIALIENYSKVGNLYNSLNISSKSLTYHLKADSLSHKTNINSPSLGNSYKYLIKYFKEKNNLGNQLLYINRLLKLNEYFSKEREKINKTFTEEYDIPNLLAEKKKIISRLENNAEKSRRNKLIYITLISIATFLILYQRNRKKVYKKRFLALVNQNKFVNSETKDLKETVIKFNTSKLADEIVNDILNKLNTFEKNKDFLSSHINLKKLASKFNTNTSYLSKVINLHKENTYTNYINKLRIEYTISKLKSDSIWRKYTIKAIAEEVGFKNAESFSKAFYKFTEIKPSYFIKELEKNKS